MTFKEYYIKRNNLEEGLIDVIQMGLDIAGLEPTIGSGADAANVIISGLRAAMAKERDERKKHIMNAAISAVSILPLGDVAKIFKGWVRKPVVKGLKALRKSAKLAKKPSRFRD